MNKARRKQLDEAIEMINKAVDLLNNANEIIETCKDEEQEAYDNMPEGLQNSEKGEHMYEVIDSLENIFSELSAAVDTCLSQADEIESAKE